MDIHPPHPIHSWKDFGLQLLTITVGLFIALSLEALVERAHHRSLVGEARENIRAEVDTNRRSLLVDIQNVNEAKTQVDASMDGLRQMRAKPGSKLTVGFGLHWIHLSDAAWRTARDTGALGYMTQTEVQDYAGLYSLQQDVEGLGNEQLVAQASAAAPLLIDHDAPTADAVNTSLGRAADNLIKLDLLGQILPQLSKEYASRLTK